VRIERDGSKFRKARCNPASDVPSANWKEKRDEDSRRHEDEGDEGG
jgi:hypothetical protein